MTIFVDDDEAVQTFRTEYLGALPMAQFFQNLSDEALYKKILQAENTVKNRLRICLEPTIIFPQPTGCLTDEQLDCLDGQAYEIEPGYDWDPTMFQTDRWGFIATNKKPVIEVLDYRIIYTDAQDSLFNIPLTWIRLDRQYGHVRLVPTGNMAMVALQTSLLPLFAVSRLIPNGARLKYKAGFKDVFQEQPDLVAFIFRQAMANALKDLWIPSSGSISADGLSQSSSFDINKMLYGDGKTGGLAEDYKYWKQWFHGPVVMVI